MIDIDRLAKMDAPAVRPLRRFPTMIQVQRGTSTVAYSPCAETAFGLSPASSRSSRKRRHVRLRISGCASWRAVDVAAHPDLGPDRSDTSAFQETFQQRPVRGLVINQDPSSPEQCIGHRPASPRPTPGTRYPDRSFCCWATGERIGCIEVLLRFWARFVGPPGGLAAVVVQLFQATLRFSRTFVFRHDLSYLDNMSRFLLLVLTT